jgi:hypothetical protein
LDLLKRKQYEVRENGIMRSFMKSRKLRLVGNVTRMGGLRKIFKILVKKHEK